MSNTANPHLLGNMTGRGVELARRTRSLPRGHVFVYQLDTPNQVAQSSNDTEHNAMKLDREWHVCIKGEPMIFAVSYNLRDAKLVAHWLAGSLRAVEGVK